MTRLDPPPPPARATGVGLIALLLLLVASEPARAGDTDTARTSVRWDSGLERLGLEARRVLPAVDGEVAARLGWAYGGPPVDVAIVRDHDRMVEEARAGVPRWAVGVALSQEARIVVRADLLAAGYGGTLASVLRHEWVHLSWGWRAGADRRVLPLWAEEGLAEEIGGGVSVDAGAALDLAAAFGRLLAFEDLRTSFPADAAGADLAYRQSRSWIGHVAGRAGWGSIRAVLEDVATGQAVRSAAGRDPFAEAVRRRTGLSLGEWHGSWRQALETDARPWFHLLFRDLTSLLLACLAVSAAGLWFVLVARRRRDVAALADDNPGAGGDDDRNLSSGGGQAR